ncbi:hypothetical protein FNV43_RR17727 [Rhamnella rubrinervis]|uniref:Pentatricopeptide repeat-containing protein n=1 Tax=Rhamnella rubrinervis TaxID=2594499 RepID=A0A8K0GV41_9ROSA|nr:hypothetical protein FNV43_RR17727 [Rhamnella rubrinervis]
MDVSQKFFEATKAYASLRSMLIARKLHAQLISIGLDASIFLQNYLLHMYSNCSLIDDALRPFLGIQSPNVFSSNTMLFNNLTEQNAISWTSMISGVAQFGLEEEALILFNRMRKGLTLATVLGVCSGEEHLLVGKELHGRTINAGMDSSIPVGNSLITMYAKCEKAHEAYHVFELLPCKDVMSWTATITTYSQAVSACADLAMLKLGIQIIGHPEKLGFGSNALVAISCSHSELVTEGKRYFGSMTEDFGISQHVGILHAWMHHNSKFAEFGVRNLLELHAEDFWTTHSEGSRMVFAPVEILGNLKV